MGISYNPSVTINGLISSIDFGNPKSFQPRENLFVYSENQPLAGVSNSILNAFFINTATTLSPLGSTASTLIINTSTTTNYNYISENYSTTQTGYYTLSLHVKPYNTNTITMIFGTNGFYTYANGTGTAYNLVTINPNTSAMTYRNFTNSTTNVNTVADFSWGATPAANGWTRYWMTMNATTTTFLTSLNGGFYIGDPPATTAAAGTGVYTWGWQLESSNIVNTYVQTTAAVVPKNYQIIDYVSNNTAVSYYQSSYISNTPNGYVQFNRFPATTSTQKAGGNLQINNPQGAMSVTNFLYGDHTWEIWARIDDSNYTNADATEAASALAVYTGYHAGWYYAPTYMNYFIWNSPIGGVNFINNMTIGTTGSVITQGRWNQIVISKTGVTATSYVNAQVISILTGTVQTSTVVTQNLLNFGGAYSAAVPSTNQYLWYSKSSIAINRMYNRGLSADEIRNNFNANRGRFGI